MRPVSRTKHHPCRHQRGRTARENIAPISRLLYRCDYPDPGPPIVRAQRVAASLRLPKNRHRTRHTGTVAARHLPLMDLPPLPFRTGNNLIADHSMVRRPSICHSMNMRLSSERGYRLLPLASRPAVEGCRG